MTPGGDLALAVSVARLRVLPGVGHFLSRDIWGTYSAELRAFVE